MSRRDVIVVGAGLAGLACARTLQRAGVDCCVLEAADAVGGRVRSDVVDGFTLDRGFQVLLTAYPEVRAALDLAALDLRPFAPGALVRSADGLQRLADPWRDPGHAIASLRSRAATFVDKLRIAALRARLRRRDLDAIFETPDRPTLEYLRDAGFSSRIVERFFRPFLGGIFLDAELTTSSRMFEFVFKMFATGDAAVPARGMQAIPERLAADLAPGTVRLDAPVERIEGTAVGLGRGERLEAERIVLAVDGHSAASLVGRPGPAAWRSTVCFYFDAPEPPVDEPVLVLDGTGAGPVNNLCTLSRVAPEYAPRDRALVSVSVVGGADGDLRALERAVREQLTGWFGSAVSAWRALRHYAIDRALPAAPSGVGSPSAGDVIELGPVVVCGDHVANGSIQGAMRSGRRAAERLLQATVQSRPARGA